MLPDRVSNPGHLTYESGALPIVPRGPAVRIRSRPEVIKLFFLNAHKYENIKKLSIFQSQISL